MTIVDSFLGNDELSLAHFRVRYLSREVSFSYVGESAFTFSGKSKPLIFQEYVSSNPDLVGRLIPVLIEIPDNILLSGNRWAIEEYSRDELLRVVLEKHPDDVVVFSDLDEVPSIGQLRELSKISQRSFARDLPMWTAVRFGNWIRTGEDASWRKAKAIRGHSWQSQIRYQSFQSLETKDGFHFSYLGLTAADVQKKYAEFSHAEFDHAKFSSLKLLDFADEYGINHTGRGHDRGFGLLKRQRFESLSDLQIALQKHQASWFDFSANQKSVLRRIAASWALTKFIHLNAAEDFYQIAGSRWLSPRLLLSLVEAFSYAVLRELGLAKVSQILKPLFSRP